MANEAKKNNNKGVIIGICAALVVAVLVVIAVIMLSNGSRISDAYFVSDGTKYVLTIESDGLSSEEDGYTPVKSHYVYTYEGENVTGLKSYDEYADAATAQKAYDEMKNSDKDMSAVELNGKYIITTASAEEYEGVTASDVKQQIEFMEMLKDMDFEDEDVIEEGEVVDDVEAVDTTKNAE